MNRCRSCADDDVAEICAREVGGVVQSRVGVTSTIVRLPGYRWDQGEMAPDCDGLFAELDRALAQSRDAWPDSDPVFHAGVGHLGMVMLIGLLCFRRAGINVGVLCTLSDRPDRLPVYPASEWWACCQARGELESVRRGEASPSAGESGIRYLERN